MDQRTITIQKRNDLARTAMGVASRLFLTSGVLALGDKACSEIREQVEKFDNFNQNNDPYGEHDFGSFNYVDGAIVEKIFWKIDVLDRNYEYGLDGDDPKAKRVLTILLASEY